MMFDIVNPNVAIPTAPFCSMNPRCFSSNFTYRLNTSSSAEMVECTPSCTACTQLDDRMKFKFQIVRIPALTRP